MKLIIATALAVFAVPAIAQDTPATPPPPSQTTPTPPVTDSTAPPAPTTAEPAPPAAPMPAPPAAPAGTVMGPSTPVVQPLTDAATAPTDGKVPMCTKAVTDHCMERSNARGERLHSTPRARK